MQDNELCCKESLNAILSEDATIVEAAVKRKSEYWHKREREGCAFRGGEFTPGGVASDNDRDPIEVACKVKDFDEASLVAVSGPLHSNPTSEDMACQSTSGLQLDEKGAYRIVPLGLISIQSEVHHLKNEIKGKRQQLADAKLNVALSEELIQLQSENAQIDDEMQKLSNRLTELVKLRNQLKN